MRSWTASAYNSLPAYGETENFDNFICLTFYSLLSMGENTYKSQKRRDLFTYLEEHSPVDSSSFQGLPGRYMPRLLFLFMLGILYVGNTHYHEKLARKIAHLEAETAELRVDYTTLQAGYMFDSKQSEVAKRVARMGLVEAPYPPLKIKSE